MFNAAQDDVHATSARILTVVILLRFPVVTLFYATNTVLSPVTNDQLLEVNEVAVTKTDDQVGERSFVQEQNLGQFSFGWTK